MSSWMKNYFSNPAQISYGRRISSIVFAVLLFLALAVFGVMMVVHLTVFNPDYIASYVDDIDISNSATIWLNENVAPDRPVVARAAALSITYFEPQIKDQLHSAVRDIYSFFLNRLEQGRLLETLASQRPLVNNVVDNLQAILNVPALRSLLNNLGIDPSAISNQVNSAQINSLFDLLERLARYQSLLVFVKHFYIPLIIIIIALIAGIVFVGRKFRFILVVLGITFSAYGILQLSTSLPFGNLAASSINNLNLNSLATDTASRFISDIIRMLTIFSAAILFCGLVLIGVYFITRSRRSAVNT